MELSSLAPLGSWVGSDDFARLLERRESSLKIQLDPLLEMKGSLGCVP